MARVEEFGQVGIGYREPRGDVQDKRVHVLPDLGVVCVVVHRVDAQVDPDPPKLLLQDLHRPHEGGALGHHDGDAEVLLLRLLQECLRLLGVVLIAGEPLVHPALVAEGQGSVVRGGHLLADDREHFVSVTA